MCHAHPCTCCSLVGAVSACSEQPSAPEGLAALERTKSSAMCTLLQVWEGYTGEQVETQNGHAESDKLLEQPETATVTVTDVADATLFYVQVSRWSTCSTICSAKPLLSLPLCIRLLWRALMAPACEQKLAEPAMQRRTAEAAEELLLLHLHALCACETQCAGPCRLVPKSSCLLTAGCEQMAEEKRLGWLAQQLASLGLEEAPQGTPRLAAGSLCAAQFSLDKLWYRARVSSVRGAPGF